VAAPCARRAGVVLWIVPDDVVVESVVQIKTTHKLFRLSV
jgi:hypothetical protein